MIKNKKNLIWIDLEMTGLDTNNDAIIEIATVVTDSVLEILSEGPILAIKQSEAALKAMDPWNTKQHGESGLTERVRNSIINESQAEYQTINFLDKYVPPGVSPMCGNSICQDRRFIARCMPKLESYFHYRNLDVSSLKELARRWYPKIEKSFKKKSLHLAMYDIKDAINELKHYRKHFINLPAKPE